MDFDDGAVQGHCLDFYPDDLFVLQALEDALQHASTPALLQRLMRVYTVCQLPKRLGRPRHLQPCSAT